MGLRNTIEFIVGHPLNRDAKVEALVRFVAWQVWSLIARGPHEIGYAGGTRLLISRGQTGATGNIYTGLHELAEMAFLLHALRPGELFIDVGANIGSYTILASGAVGARSIAFEPDPGTAASLRANVACNDVESLVDIRESAVGATVGEVRFTSGQDTLNHVLPAGTDQGRATPITTLDLALRDERPTILKVDVEGYERDVIAGAENILSSASLMALIIETNGSGARYSVTDNVVHASIVKFGFVPCTYDPLGRNVRPMAGPTPDGNTIYVRNVGVIAERVKSAPRFDIAGRLDI